VRRVLIISYYWPPSGGAGVQRWLKFVKYLRNFGWEPVLFIPENPEYPEIDHSLEKDIPENLEIIRQPIWEPYDYYKKLIGRKKEERINAAFLSEKKKNSFIEQVSVWIRGNLFIPDARRFWIKPSVKTLSAYLKDHPVSAVISTGPPHSTHLIALPLSKRFSIPWIADLRDPWTNIDFYKDLRLTAGADKKHRLLERSVLEQANRVVVISRLMAEDCRKIHGREYDVVTNGYDPGDLTATDVPLDRKFSIAHIGTLVSTRNPLPFWEALKSITEERQDFAADLEVSLVGKTDYTVTETIKEFGLESYIRKTDYLPHNEVVIRQRQAQVLLLIINNTPNAGMILTGKFFEYLAAGRPILCLGPEEGDAAAILRETQAGLLSGFGDREGMKKNILTFYEKFREGNLKANNTGIERYSREALTERIASILDEICSESRPG
jgi:glycosyltransferase involved in cell wall biosynthesis